MSRVGAGGRVATGQGSRHRSVSDRSCEAPIAYGLEPAVPTFARQPHFDLDVRIRLGLERRADPAERRQAFGIR